jgi:transcription initiation factor IIE alpha subunit
MITFRFPLRDLPKESYAEWQKGYRERLLKLIEDLEDISDADEFFEEADSIRTCPNCFCPNMTSFFAVNYGVKGFHCPACGNSFDMGIPLPLDQEYLAPGYVWGP